MKIYLTILFIALSVSFSFSQINDLPYTTGFDTPAEKLGWKEYRTGFASTSHWQNTGSGFSGKGLSHDYNVGGQESEIVQDWYVSPEINFQNLEAKLSLKIFSAGFSVPFGDNLLVYFIGGDQDPTKGDTTLIGNLSALEHGSWLDTSVIIPALEETGFIAFKYKTKGAAWTTYAIDNIEIRAATAGLKSNKFIGLTNIYPSVATDKITLELDEIALNNMVNYELINSAGQVISKNQIILSELTNIERNGLTSGIYFIKFNQINGGIKTVKFSFN